jgi:hypothetical protein
MFCCHDVSAPLPWTWRDRIRAVQFLRFHKDRWKLKATLTGRVSAGANAARYNIRYSLR